MGNRNIKIRKVGNKDWTKLYTLLNKVFYYLEDKYYPKKFIKSQKDIYTQEKIKEITKNEKYLSLGCFHNKELIAFSIGYFMPISYLFYLEWIGIHPKYMRQGLFSRLLKTLEKRVVENFGAHKIYLYTSLKNIPAINGYLKNGYNIEGILPKHFQGIDFCIIGKIVK